MTEEEISSRILVCEIKEREYREVGNVKTADRYSKEKYKWETLLDKLNPKRDEELKQFKKGYYRLEQALNEIKEYSQDLRLYDNDSIEFKISRDILQIIDRALENNGGD